MLPLGQIRHCINSLNSSWIHAYFFSYAFSNEYHPPTVIDVSFYQSSKMAEETQSYKLLIKKFYGIFIEGIY